MNWPTSIPLTSSDLLAMQGLLCDNLRQVLTFEGHVLYFPRENAPETPHLLTREKKLVLPLFKQTKLLGVLVLHKIDSGQIRRLLPCLTGIASLCLDNLARIKAQMTDRVTGFFTEEVLYNHIEEESAQMGLIVIRLCNGAKIVSTCGYSFAQDFLHHLAEACRKNLPSEVLPARVGNFSLAFLTPAPGRKFCNDLAQTIFKDLYSVQMRNKMTQEIVRPELAAGYALFPQDMPGQEMHLPLNEQARLLMHRATLACDVAEDGRILAYFAMSSQGGRITEILPFGRLRINLGRQMGIKTGSSFAVFDAHNPHIYKGEIVVVLVQEQSAIAEISYREDATILPTIEDYLTEKVTETDKTILPEGLANQDEFLKIFAEKNAELSFFTLVLLRVLPKQGQSASESLKIAWQAWREIFACDQSALAGLRSVNTIFFWHPAVKSSTLLARYKTLCETLTQQKLSVAAGLAEYPFLSFNKTEMENCALMALEYALLLPAPHVGICNSLALNISADRRYSQGDLFGAVQEYKLALLADAGNVLAWNSLGVCMAALGHREEACRHFKDGLRQAKDPARFAQICYNLGTIYQNAGKRRLAANYFRQCVKKEPQHLFAWLRLGQLCEQGGRRAEARRLYERAAQIEDELGQNSNLARRHLARIAAHQKRGEEARRLLQEALLRNPRDASAMLFLAKLYLDGNEDPAVAEMLARRSVLLQDKPEGWQILASALRALNREEEACRAEARSLLPFSFSCAMSQ